MNVMIELITPYFFFVFTDNGSVPTYRNAGEMSEHMKENKWICLLITGSLYARETGGKSKS